MVRPRHGLKDGSQQGWKEGGGGRNRNVEPCADSPSDSSKGVGQGGARGKGRNRR